MGTVDLALILADLERLVGIVEVQAERIAALEALLTVSEPRKLVAPTLH